MMQSGGDNMYLNEKLKGMWHGCDYNPDQWTDYPEVLKKDIEYMKKTHCNVMSVGIFSWSKLEPEEGVFCFEWLDKIIDDLYKNGIYTILATPSGAMPAWMAEKYPEIKRMTDDGIRNRFGNRHNNCFSSPIYRQKVRIINTKLAQRYASHPGVVMWHISNEYYIGDCHCPLCVTNFQKWLEEKYKTIDELNKKWWNSFWSHNYQSFSQITPPGNHGEKSSNPLKLEWFRFKNDLLKSFIENEIEAVKSVDPTIPVTANFMQLLSIDYYKLSKCLDVISWDNYPLWHSQQDEFSVAVQTASYHALFHSLKKDRPFMLMESSPSATNWQDVSKLRRPGMHLLASMQAVAHGSDTVQYFQWRKSRGQSEQFHGAVISHDNSCDTRVFRDVQTVGASLVNIAEVASSVTRNEAAILMDYESIHSLSIAQAYRNIEADKGFNRVLQKIYGALWNLNMGCDFAFCDEDFSQYKVIIAPMLFMVKPRVKEKIEAFVKNGGTFVATFASGVIDEYGLSFFDEECYPFRKLLGVKAEETDSLYDGETNSVELYGKKYICENYCELAYPEGAKVLGAYAEDFYKGMPAVTVKDHGKGKAYYIAADFRIDGYTELFCRWFADVISAEKMVSTPQNVSVTMRYKDDQCYVFVLNFNNAPVEIDLPFAYELLVGDLTDQTIAPFGVAVLKKR